jgi:hypothetical protein
MTPTWSNEPMAEELRSPFAPVGLADGEDPPALELGHQLVPPPGGIGQLTYESTEQATVRQAIAAGIRDVNELTNAYFRMFGMGLNHGMDDNRAYPFLKPAASNVEFVTSFEEFLREVWRGIENYRNQSGPNSTDDAAISALARRLYDMLVVRRLNGNLSREEFFIVASMSWFHLTLSFDTPIVVDLRAGASSAEERLMKVGQRIGLPAHSKAESYFPLALAMSRILIGIEAGLYNQPGNVRVLYTPPPPPPVPQPVPPPPAPYDDMAEIITHWSLATGRDMKARKVTISPRGPAPAPGVPTPATNGYRAAVPARS